MSTTTTDSPTDPDLARLVQASKALSEHFDTVLILTTRYEGDGKTEAWHTEAGNQFALRGSAEQWLDEVCNRGEEEEE